MTLLSAYDYIITGAGSSGCVIAGRIARETHASVLLIEAGAAAEDNPDTLSADGFKYCFANDNVMLDRFSTQQNGLNNRRLYQGTGTTMGGSGSVNGMVYTRGDKSDFDSWPPGWQWDDVTPAFSALEQRIKPRPRAATAFTKAAIAASEACGFTHKDGLTDGKLTDFIGHNAMNYEGNERTSSYRAFLHEQVFPNLHILHHTRTHRVLIDQGRATGVEIHQDQGVVRIQANCEVVLCAGALETPKLLMLSGIGPVADISKVGIQPILDHPYIGKNLQDHPNVCLFYRGKRNIDFAYPQLYAFTQCHPEPPTDRPGQPDTCLAFFAAPITLKQSMYRMIPALALPKSWYRIKFLRQLLRTLVDAMFCLPFVNRFIDNLYGIVVILGKPLSRGSLTLQSADVHDEALIDPCYFQHPRDRETLIRGIDKVKCIAEQTPLKAWGSRPLSAGAKKQTSAQLDHFINQATMTTFHFCGTCKMGENQDAPVDTQLQLKGIKGLRIADASVIPEIPVSAINAPSMMIGYRAADFIIADYTTYYKNR